MGNITVIKFSMSTEQTRRNKLNLQQKSFQLYTRNYFLTVRVVKHWKRLPRDFWNLLHPKTSKSMIDIPN